MNEFGNFLYALRKEKGMTQQELADKLGVTNKAVSKWETGEAMPETGLLLPISRIFGVSVDELLDGKRRPENGAEEKSAFRFEDGEENFCADKQHLFTDGEDEEKRKPPLSEIICGALCSAGVMLGVLAFLVTGLCADVWHPYWVFIPVGGLASGIIGIIFELRSAEKRRRQVERGENPVTAAICGFVMLGSLIAFLLLGAFLDMWHPLWIIIVVAAVICSIIGTVGKIAAYKK